MLNKIKIVTNLIIYNFIDNPLRARVMGNFGAMMGAAYSEGRPDSRFIISS